MVGERPGDTTEWHDQFQLWGTGWLTSSGNAAARVAILQPGDRAIFSGDREMKTSVREGDIHQVRKLS